MKLKEIRLVWLEKQEQYGLAVELQGTDNKELIGRLRIKPDASAGEVVSALHNLADAIQELNEDYGE